MILREYAYLLLISLTHLAFTYFWNTKFRKRVFQGRNLWILCAFTSLFLSWGIDALERIYDVDTLNGVAQISFGSWLVFVFATTAKYYVINKRSWKEYWLDYGGDLLGFFIVGFGIYAIT